MKGANIGCDCVLFQLLERGSSFIKRTWYVNNSCTYPERLKGRYTDELMHNFTLREDMICEVQEECPKKCTCFEQPRFNHFVVNCSNAGIMEFPKKLSWHANYSLLLDGNNINSLTTVDSLLLFSLKQALGYLKATDITCHQ